MVFLLLKLRIMVLFKDAPRYHMNIFVAFAQTFQQSSLIRE